MLPFVGRDGFTFLTRSLSVAFSNVSPSLAQRVNSLMVKVKKRKTRARRSFSKEQALGDYFEKLF
jgi:hypothetical protein